jgi:predicted nuclease of predicted toxin-antitoxin system
MTLLFDHNLSPRLVTHLSDVFPNATHTEFCGLAQASDMEVWTFAQVNGCAIVTKDTDFIDLSVFRGFPPKVILLRVGNCTTGQIVVVLRSNAAAIAGFMGDPASGLLELA